MSDKSNKKTKDDFTSLLLGDDQDQQKTAVFGSDKNENSSSEEKTKIYKPTILGGENKAPAKVENKKEDLNKTVRLTVEETKKTLPTNKSEKVFPAKMEPPEETKSITNHPKNDQKKEGFFNKDNLDPSLFSLEAALKQSEYLRMAQAKIKDLESKLNDLSAENQTLAASAIVLQKKYDEQISKIDNLKLDQKSHSENLKDELILKEKIIHLLEKEIEELLRKNEEYKALTGEKVQQVRVRERELQNRLEILQQEGDVVITTKDETILDLKKQIDQLHFEIENFKTQSRELNLELQEQKDQARRSIKALRLALSLLENEDLKIDELKKTGT